MNHIPEPPNSDQPTIRDQMLRFAEAELEFEPIDDQFILERFRRNWQACAECGVLGYSLPEQLGGRGLTITQSIERLEALGYAFPDDGFTLAVNSQVWAVQEPILRFGTPEQHARFLPGLADGSLIGAYGMTEESTGSNALNLQTTAKKKGDGFILNGKKIYIGLGPIADLVLLFAVTDPDKGHWGLSAFVVDASTEGVLLSEPQDKMGLRSTPLGEIEFKDVFVEADRIIGREGAGASIFHASMDFERSFILSSHVGSMERLLDQTIEFAKNRDLGTGPISQYQSVTNRIADMKIRLEASRLFLYNAARKVDAGQPATIEAAMAKLVISENYVQNCMDAVRIHGGRGYLAEYGIERKLRDAMGGVIYSGTSDIQRNLIAGVLGVR